MSVIMPLDAERLRPQFRDAMPFPCCVIDNFLQPSIARDIAHSYPSFEDARLLGREFKAVNENRKVQIVDYERFPAPVKTLADALAAPETLRTLEQVSGISGLEWDPSFAGGGMHQTASSGWLDVHVDFNYLEALGMYRRLNILIFLNPGWNERWGGLLELWDADVAVRHQALAPVHNRCVVFETSETSFHGVTPVKCPEGWARRSFAAYYYTREAPRGGAAKPHTTLFRARPDEHAKRYVLMPAERAGRALQDGVRRAKSFVKGKIGSSDPR